MKLAIVCDDLIQFGGAERVLMAALEMWKEAPVYTSVASQEWIDRCKDNGIELHTSCMQKIPYASKLNRYLAPFFLHIIAFQSFDFSNYDVVLSFSARFAHHIITKPRTKHICYMHSPGRMFWEPFEYFENESYSVLSPIKKLAVFFLSLPLSIIRVLDYVASKRVDLFVSNSKTAQRRIKKYYGQESKVIYPFIDLDKNFIDFSKEKEELKKDGESKDYFLIITRLVSWKKVEIAIKACEEMGISLKIVGEGPDKERLISLAGSNTKFVGYVGEREKIEMFKGCKALINTQLEDFGIASLEALACGKPVIAYGSGGVLETIEPGITGEFFYKQTSDCLKELLVKFDSTKYNPETCIERSNRFSKDKFKKEIFDLINNVYL